MHHLVATVKVSKGNQLTPVFEMQITQNLIWLLFFSVCSSAYYLQQALIRALLDTTVSFASNNTSHFEYVFHAYTRTAVLIKSLTQKLLHR